MGPEAKPHRVRRVLAALPMVLVSLVLAGLCAGLLAVWTGGWRLEAVLTSSMEPELPQGSLALTKPISPRHIDVGDVVSYADAERGGAPVLHRVIDVVEQGGTRFFEFQGDANNAPDALLVPEERVRSQMRGHVPRAGDAMAWLADGWHRWLLPGVPLALTLLRSAFVRRRARATPTSTCPTCGAAPATAAP
jgi:signal peptidase